MIIREILKELGPEFKSYECSVELHKGFKSSANYLIDLVYRFDFYMVIKKSEDRILTYLGNKTSTIKELVLELPLTGNLKEDEEEAVERFSELRKEIMYYMFQDTDLRSNTQKALHSLGIGKVLLTTNVENNKKEFEAVT